MRKYQSIYYQAIFINELDSKGWPAMFCKSYFIDIYKYIFIFLILLMSPIKK